MKRKIRMFNYELKTRLKIVYWVFAHKNGYSLLTDEVKRIIKCTYYDIYNTFRTKANNEL